MKIFLVITIDTEIDKSPDWRVSANETFLSVLDGIPKKLTPLFNQFGARPTYLLSSEVIENKDCVSLLRSIANCELGTHLHGDLVEPQRKVYKLANTRTSAMQNSYPSEIEYQKLKNLTNLFIEKFGFSPSSFRAGRFAAGNNTITLLQELGYLVDSSVTPGVDWNFPEGRANFLGAKEQPYFPSKENLLEEGNSTVLEVPVSIFTPRFKKHFYALDKLKGLKLVSAIINTILPTRWLRPSLQSSSGMLGVIAKMIKRYGVNNAIVLNMMFHSMEVIPNASPYTKTEDECQALLKRIEAVLEYCATNNFTFATLSELYPVFCQK
ncbi:hypothetical protein ES706_06307 [subsurface metagenome]